MLVFAVVSQAVWTELQNRGMLSEPVLSARVPDETSELTQRKDGGSSAAPKDGAAYRPTRTGPVRRRQWLRNETDDADAMLANLKHELSALIDEHHQRLTSSAHKHAEPSGPITMQNVDGRQLEHTQATECIQSWTADETAILTAIFSRYDINDSGTINSMDELQMLVSNLCFKLEAHSDEYRASSYAKYFQHVLEEIARDPGQADVPLPLGMDEFRVWFDCNRPEVST